MPRPGALHRAGQELAEVLVGRLEAGIGEVSRGHRGKVARSLETGANERAREGGACGAERAYAGFGGASGCGTGFGARREPESLRKNCSASAGRAL